MMGFGDQPRAGLFRDGPNTQIPEAEVARDALDNGGLIDESHDPHLVGAAGPRSASPDLLDEFAPLLRGNAARLVGSV